MEIDGDNKKTIEDDGIKCFSFNCEDFNDDGNILSSIEKDPPK